MLKIILTVLAVLYLVSPYDILPDFLVGPGWLDDAAVLALLWRFFYSSKARYSYQQHMNRRQRRFYSGTSHTNDGDRQTETEQPFVREFDPYEILQVRPGATDHEIKQAYREQVKQYHPDKVAHLGEEFKALAEERFKEIQRAYREIGPQ